MPISEIDLKEWQEKIAWEKETKTISDFFFVTQCQTCRHFNQWSRKKPRCTAYQDLIPLKIFYGKHDHHYPYPGDEGILYEPIEKTTPTNEY